MCLKIALKTSNKSEFQLNGFYCHYSIQRNVLNIFVLANHPYATDAVDSGRIKNNHRCGVPLI